MSFLERIAVVFGAMIGYGFLVGGFLMLLSVTMGDAMWSDRDFLVLTVPAAIIMLGITLLGAGVAGYYSYSAGGGVSFGMVVAVMVMVVALQMMPIRPDATPRPEEHRLSPKSLALSTRFPGWTMYGRTAMTAIGLPAGLLLARRKREQEDYEAMRHEVLGPRG